MKKLIGLLAIAGCIAPLHAEERWEIQYRYRQVDSTLTINDLSFPDDKHGIACGFVTDRKDRDRSVVLVSGDGGENWAEVPVKETCLSLFFLPDSSGWMVTDSGIWTSSEAGRNWVKLKNSPTNLLRVHFLDRDRGFAAGREKHVYETKDGGNTWTPLAVAANPQGDAVYTTYGDISFAGKKGMIVGWNIPPRRGGPDWMEPAQALRDKQVPHLVILLQTKTSGDAWTYTESSLFGQITRVSLSALGVGLGLVEFKDQFDYPSEVYSIDLVTGKNELSFRAKDRAITDVRLFADSNRAIVAGYETTGPSYRSPIPGKLRVLTSQDRTNWTEMTVDYRAVAHSAVIAGPDSKHLWIATDTGMILKLTE